MNYAVENGNDALAVSPYRRHCHLLGLSHYGVLSPIMGLVANYGGCRQLWILSPIMGVVANYGICCQLWGLSPIMGFVANYGGLSPMMGFFAYTVCRSINDACSTVNT